jgi:hypothetical protein
MNLPAAIATLRQIQLEQGDDFVARFENVLADIAAMNDRTCIVLLCAFFDDDAEFDELMFSIIHTIENFDDATYASELVKAAPRLCERAPRWASIVFMRVLNSPTSTAMLVDALRNGTDEQRESVYSLMRKINDVSAEFIEKTQPVLEVLS